MAKADEDKDRRRARLLTSNALGGAAGTGLAALATPPADTSEPDPVPEQPAPYPSAPAPAEFRPKATSKPSPDERRADQGKPVTFSFQPTLLKTIRKNWRVWAGTPERAEKYDGFVSENAYTQALIAYAMERTAGNQREAARLEQYLPTNMRGRR